MSFFASYILQIVLLVLIILKSGRMIIGTVIVRFYPAQIEHLL
jgi:hypothetical protein